MREGGREGRREGGRERERDDKREGGMEGGWVGDREGGREGGRDAASTLLVFYFYAAQKNIMWAHRLTYILLQNNWLAWCASDPRCVGRLLMRLGLL